MQGVSNCYVFKSRLQEYAQKKGLPTPVYETIKEGPSHEPSFKSTVILNEVRYDSLPGFFNRKAAEQSAAEVALLELAKSNEVECISQPVHETGLCKNLLQEYAQKMNYAIPLYQCQKIETASRATLFKCTVEIGGIQYIGASAKTKKEAEIKAARTALLAIQSSASESSYKSLGNSQLTVIPFKKRAAENATVLEEATNVPKAKKARFKKKISKKKLSRTKIDFNQSEHTGKLGVIVDQQSENNQIGVTGKLDVIVDPQLDHTKIEPPSELDVIAEQQLGSETEKSDASMVEATTYGLLPVVAVEMSRDEGLSHESGDKETIDVIGFVNKHNCGDSECVPSTTIDCSESKIGISTRIADVNEDATKASGVDVAQIEPSSFMASVNPSKNEMSTGMITDSNEDAAKVSGVALDEIEPSTLMAGLNPLAESIEAGAGRC